MPAEGEVAEKLKELILNDKVSAEAQAEKTPNVVLEDDSDDERPMPSNDQMILTHDREFPAIIQQIEVLLKQCNPHQKISLHQQETLNKCLLKRTNMLKRMVLNIRAAGTYGSEIIPPLILLARPILE